MLSFCGAATLRIAKKGDCVVERNTIWTPVFMQLMAFEFLSQLAFALVNPVIANYAVELGASLSVAGFLAGLSSLTALFLRPFGGLVMSRASRKRLLIIATILFAFSSFVCVAAGSTPFLGVSRVINGAAFVVKSSLVVVLASSLVPKSCVGQGIGWIGLAYTVTNAVGPGIGSWLGNAFGYGSAFFAAGVLFIVALVIAILLRSPQENTGNSETHCGSGSESMRSKLYRKGLSRFVRVKTIPLALITVCEAFLYGTIINLVLLVSEQRGIENAPLFFLVYAIVSMLVRPITSKWYDQYGLSKVLYPEAVLMCFAVLVLMLSYSLLSLVFAAVILALGQGSLYPSLQAESVKEADGEDSALAVNTFYMGPDVGMAVGPIVSGCILQAFGSNAMYLMSFCMGILFTVGYWAYDCWRKRKGMFVSSGSM